MEFIHVPMNKKASSKLLESVFLTGFCVFRQDRFPRCTGCFGDLTIPYFPVSIIQDSKMNKKNYIFYGTYRLENRKQIYVKKVQCKSSESYLFRGFRTFLLRYLHLSLIISVRSFTEHIRWPWFRSYLGNCSEALSRNTENLSSFFIFWTMCTPETKHSVFTKPGLSL